MNNVNAYEKIEIVKEQMINRQMFKIIVRTNRPSPEAIKRCAEIMLKLNQQVDERAKD
ncbi:hypothetical protein [Clostridium sp. HMP27]|uniref:hypothetical protein n=1 Tax=Clostridium sp. HMP27 TaxID=1487921 RepID=UPI000B239756|nr:hypothetical protein [Clostridium sp. HMP27]